MICLGLGNGVVFQIVPQRFPASIGVVTGIVGAVGGVGGFVLPAVLGAARQVTGSYSPGLIALASAAAGAARTLSRLRRAAPRPADRCYVRLAPAAEPLSEPVQRAG
jgi:NNP family nitrate/nitrite transporter-like MFS transporter